MVEGWVDTDRSVWVAAGGEVRPVLETNGGVTPVGVVVSTTGERTAGPGGSTTDRETRKSSTGRFLCQKEEVKERRTRKDSGAIRSKMEGIR